MPHERGLTLTEIVMVIVLIGLMSALAFPYIGDAITAQNVRSARAAVVTMHAKARATAIQRATRTVLEIDGSRLRVLWRDPATGLMQPLPATPDQDLYERYGVTLSTDRTQLSFDARGLGNDAGTTTIYVRKGSLVDSVVITAIGRVMN